MYQNIKLLKPIPSCELSSLLWVAGNSGLNTDFDGTDDGHWEYVYAVNTPEELTEDNEEQDFMVYEYISDLIVRYGHKVHEEAVNIHFRKLSQYMELLQRQRKVDIAFRERWMKENGKTEKDVPEHSKRFLEHKNYSTRDLLEQKIHFVAKYMGENGDGQSYFVAR